MFVVVIASVDIGILLVFEIVISLDSIVFLTFLPRILLHIANGITTRSLMPNLSFFYFSTSDNIKSQEPFVSRFLGVNHIETILEDRRIFALPSS